MGIRIQGWHLEKLFWIFRRLLVLLGCLGWIPWVGAQDLGSPAVEKEASSPTRLLLLVSLEVDRGLQRSDRLPPSLWEESLAASLVALPAVGSVYQGQNLQGSQGKSLGDDTAQAISGKEGTGLALVPQDMVPSSQDQYPPTEKENLLLRWGAPRNYDYLISGTLAVASSPSEEASLPHASGKAPSVRIHLYIRDIMSLRIIHTLEWNAPFPSEAELLQTFWLPLLDAVSSLSSTDYVTSLTIQGLPGTRVRGFTEKPVIIPEEGTAVVQVPKLHSFSWHATTPGHEDLSGSWLTMNEEETLALSPLPLLRNTLEWGMLRGQFGDFWLGRYFFQNRLHLKIGAEQYIVGFYFPSIWQAPTTESLTISLPMILPGLVGEWYFGENSLFIRPYVALGALLRLNLDQVALDPVAPLIVLGRGGLLWRVDRQWSFFGELGVDWYPLADGLLLVASQKTQSEGSSPLFLYSDRWYLDFFVFRCGVRISYE